MEPTKPPDRPPDKRRPGPLELVRTVLQVAQTVIVLTRFMGDC